MIKLFGNRSFLYFVGSLFLFIVLSLLISFGYISRYYSGIIISICINIILVSSLNLTCGVLGHLTLGHAGFMAIGAYCSAYLSKLLIDVSYIEFIVILVISGLLAALFGFIISLPCLKLRGDYLAIITLAFCEVIRNVLLNLEFLGGARGFLKIPRVSNFEICYFWVFITIVVILFYVNSKAGRSTLAIREDEIAAQASGININKYKVVCFVMAGFFAGIAGGLYAHYLGILEPNIFSFNKSIEILVMVVLGGMGNIIGGVIASIVLTLLPEYLKEFSSYRTFVYALVLILFMLFKYSPRFMIFKYHIKKRFKVLREFINVRN